MIKFKNTWLPLGFLILVVLILFSPVFTASSDKMLFGDDLFRSYGFFRMFFAGAIKSGQVPWWNPYLFSGMPFIANPSVASLYPVNWLYILMPLKIAFPAITIIHICLAMFGMFFLGRRVISPALSKISAIGMAIIFGLSGYMIARVWAGHTEIIASVAFMPWVIGLFIKTLEKPTRRLIFITALVLTVQILSGYQTIAMFTLEIVGITALLYSIKQKSLKPIMVLFLTLATGLLLSAVQLIPAFEFMGKSIRTLDFPYSWTIQGSFVFNNFRMFINPFIYGDQYTFTGPAPNYHEHAAFVSVTGLILAFVAIVYGFISKLREHKKTKPNGGNILLILGLGILITIFSFWISLGESAPINLHKILWTLIPTYKNIRMPVRHLIIAVFGLSMLAGIGLNVLKVRVIQGLLVILITIELLSYGRHFIEIKPIPGTLHDQKIISLLSQNQNEPYRLLQNFGVWISPRDALDFDAAPVYKIFSATGYDPSILSNYYSFADATIGRPVPSILEHDVQIPYLNVYSPYVDFLNIKWIMTPLNYVLTTGNPNYKNIMSNQSENFSIEENIHVSPRFFLVPNVVFEKNRSTLIQNLIKGVDLTKTVLIEEKYDRLLTDIPNCASQVNFPPVVVRSYLLNEITLSVESPCNAFLSSSEVYYPGWTAYIDGKKVPVFESNGAFRALMVPQGQHTVTMKFFPMTFAVGLTISVCTLIILIVLSGRKK